MSFNLAFFNGDVKRDRKQEAMLRSLNERENFLKNLNALSEQRIMDEKRNKAAHVVQKTWSRYRSRKAILQQFREMFDNLIQQKLDGPNLGTLFSLITNFYRCLIDDSRLVLALNEAVRVSRELSSEECAKILPTGRKYLLAKCALKFMSNVSSDANFFIIIRFLESYVLTDTEMLERCSKIGFFEAHFKLLEAITFPKPTQIGIEKPLPRAQQILSRIFAFFEKDRNVFPDSVAQRFIKAICTSSDDMIFTNHVLPAFTTALTSRNPHFCTMMKAIKEVHFTDSMSKLRQTALVVEQAVRIETGETSGPLGSLFEAMAMVLDGREVGKSRDEDGMKVDGAVDEYLKCLVDKNVESSRFRRIAQEYANLDEVNVETVIALRNVFIPIVDTLTTSNKFMKTLVAFIQLSIGNSISQIGDNLPNIGLVKNAIILLSCCIKTRISTIADSEFDPERIIDNFVPLSHFLRDTCIRLVDLVHPEKTGGGSIFKFGEESEKQNDGTKWKEVCDSVVSVLKVIYEKDMRLQFLSPTFWTGHDRSMVVTSDENRMMQLFFGSAPIKRSDIDEILFVQQLLRDYEKEDDSDSEEEDEQGGIRSPVMIRNLWTMRNVPFLVPFMHRLKIFSKLVDQIRYDGRSSHSHAFDFNDGQRLTVRRDHLYEDAFEALAPVHGEKGIDLKQRIKVRMVNWVGINEDGVDGGGIFREFLSEVLKEGFDVNKALFQYTHNRFLYPNPSSYVVYGAEYYRHYHFLGKLLGKLLLEKQLAEFRFAEFFIAQLLGSHKHVNDIDLQHMKSFDPLMFKHLRNLLDMQEAELDALQLDFSIMISELDVVKKINLKANGESIRVTVENVKEYVRLYVNYHLRIRIAPMVSAMRRGVNEVINAELLSMFSSNEIQTLIAGTEEVFSVAEMRKYCQCNNIRNTDDENYIETFWSVAERLSDDDKRNLLKFITGCSRPPIEGFQTIYPALGIQLSFNSEDLPTSATCMNLLKLPKYPNSQILEEKLKYAINSGAGFELA